MKEEKYRISFSFFRFVRNWIYVRIILQVVTETVRLNRCDFFFAIMLFVFQGQYFCLLSTIIVFLFSMKIQGSSNSIIVGKNTWYSACIRGNFTKSLASFDVNYEFWIMSINDEFHTAQKKKNADHL